MKILFKKVYLKKALALIQGLALEIKEAKNRILPFYAIAIKGSTMLNPKNIFKKVYLTPLQKIQGMKNHKYFVTGLKKAFALTAIIAVVITAYFQNTPNVSAAT